MSTPPIISLTDCTDPNAVARLSARLAALFGHNPTILPLAGADPEGTAALTLLDVLRSGGELLGGAGRPTVVLVNIAPRDGHWPNGVPFCYFRHGEHLVISTLNPRVLEPLRRHLGVTQVQVTDVREVVEAAAVGWADLRPAEIEEIVRTQFRSLWYAPLLARWLVDARPVPAHTETVAASEDDRARERPDGPESLGGLAARVAVVDNFGNCKLDLPAEALAGYAAGNDIAVFDQISGSRHEVRCYPRLVDVPRGEPGLITGSSGFGFAELVVRGGSAARLFGLREGDEPFVPLAAPALAG
jgi:S-adenosyl-l-methionine hydroxide adenosyltransferase